MHLEYGGRQIPVAAGDFVIGADEGVGFRLAGAAVRPRHAIVRQRGGALVIHRAVATATVLVNGAAIGNDPTPLLHGDRIRIGPHELVVTDPGLGGATRAMPMAGISARPDSAGRLVSLNDGREYHVTVVPFVFGRDAGAEVVIASPDASRRHAEIVSRPDGDVLVDLSSNGTYVNGSQIHGRRPLKALDVIRIGAEEFRYYSALKEPVAPVVPPAGAAARLSDTLIGLPRSRPLASLRIKSGDSKGTRHQVMSAVANLGRADSNDIKFSDPSVSSSHAKLQLREGVWIFTDLGSSNGSVVDDEPVTEETALSPGATILLGDVVISFEPNDDHVEVVPRTAVIQRPTLAPAAPAAAPESAAPRPRPNLEPVRPTANVGLMAVAMVILLAALVALVLFV